MGPSRWYNYRQVAWRFAQSHTVGEPSCYCYNGFWNVRFTFTFIICALLQSVAIWCRTPTRGSRIWHVLLYYSFVVAYLFNTHFSQKRTSIWHTVSYLRISVQYSDCFNVSFYVVSYFLLHRSTVNFRPPIAMSYLGRPSSSVTEWAGRISQERFDLELTNFSWTFSRTRYDITSCFRSAAKYIWILHKCA